VDRTGVRRGAGRQVAGQHLCRGDIGLRPLDRRAGARRPAAARQVRDPRRDLHVGTVGVWRRTGIDLEDQWRHW
jgi:hypothetical protein